MFPLRPVVTLALVLGLTGCTIAEAPPPSATSSTPPIASEGATASGASEPASKPVTKVLVFIEENHSLAQMKADMPRTFNLARRFGYATSYTAIRHPSLPNYIAIAGGQTYGISDDGPPSAHRVRGTSVFGQALAAGKTAALYAEGMPGNCAPADGGSGYAVKHNPWAYFTDEADLCRQFDVPLDQLAPAITAGTLPTVGMVVPNLCNDGHNCPLSAADAWFTDWMDRIVAGPDWRSGHLTVVLTADEDDRSAGNTVLTVVIHPSQRGHVVTTPLTHYSLTRLYEDVSATSYLYGAQSAPSMAAAFGLPMLR